MYLSYFGLREFPFSLTPDTNYFFCKGSHHNAFNTLVYALRSGEGFIKVIGEVGTGKTLLCRNILRKLSKTRFITAYISNPNLTADELPMAIADELGIKFDTNIGRHRLLKLISEYLIEQNALGKKVVLFIDEAQALADETIESLRLLTNLETEKTKLMQIVLFAQPELDVRLQQPQLRQLKQRISFSCRLKTICRTEIANYMQHRMWIGGYRGDMLFSNEALDLLFRASHGVPRLLNILGHKALMSAYGEGRKNVARESVRRAVADTEGVAMRYWPTLDFAVVGTLMSAAIVSVIAAYQHWMIP